MLDTLFNAREALVDTLNLLLARNYVRTVCKSRSKCAY